MADDPKVDPMSADEEKSEKAEDIDETLENVGLPNDDNGPKELNSEKVISEADQHQD